MKIALDISYIIIFIETICLIQDLQTRNMIGIGVKSIGLYCLNVSAPGACNTVKASQILPWHAWLGHPSTKVSSLFPFLQNTSCSAAQYPICPLAKQTRTRFSLSQSSSVSIFDLIHVDIWGSYRTPTLSSAKYFLAIVDDSSRVTWVFLMHSKYEARSLLQNFILFVENQFATRVKIVRSDNGPEFKCFAFYSQKGILYQKPVVLIIPNKMALLNANITTYKMLPVLFYFNLTYHLNIGVMPFSRLPILLTEHPHLFFKGRHLLKNYLINHPPTIIFVSLGVSVLCPPILFNPASLSSVPRFAFSWVIHMGKRVIK